VELVQGQVQRSEDIFEIPLSTIVVEDRERDVYGDIDGLAMSIMQNGQLQPIIVTEHGDAFQLVDGERGDVQARPVPLLPAGQQSGRRPVL